MKKSKQMDVTKKDTNEVCDSEADTVKEFDGVISLGIEDEEPIGEQEAILFAKWEKYMKQKGLIKVGKQVADKTQEQPSTSKEKNTGGSTINKGKTKQCKKKMMSVQSPSEATIYEAVVKMAGKNNVSKGRGSSSSEECDSSDQKEMDSSDDGIEEAINLFVGQQRMYAERQDRERDRDNRKQHPQQRFEEFDQATRI